MPHTTNLILLTCSVFFGFIFSTYAAEGPTVENPYLCKLYLSMDGDPLPSPKDSPKLLSRFSEVLDATIKPTKFVWPTSTLVSNRRMTLVRANEMIAQFLNPESPLNKESLEHILKVAGQDGFDSQKLWDLYFKSYDTVVGYSDEFLNIALAANKILPMEGTIADFGVGTGNISSILALGSASRKIIGLDWSHEGLRIAEEKMRLASGGHLDRYILGHMDLTKLDIGPKSFDGAVMNNVLYTLKNQREDVLAKIFKTLKPGAPLVLSDPSNVIQQGIGQLMLVDALKKAIAAGSPITEYDVALTGKINLILLGMAHQLPPEKRFLTSDELIEMAKRVGFEVNGYFRAYYGSASFLYLTKPRE